ncbi:MAG: hypothetical protein AAGA48_05550 [Myxococcota bacterium]
MTWLSLLVACAEPPPPPDHPPPLRSSARLIRPDAPAVATLEGIGDVHRYAMRIPPGAHRLTYTVDFDHDATALLAQVWQGGRIVDEARADDLREARTLGVHPGKRYGFVLTRQGGREHVPYRLAVEWGTERWELEPNPPEAGHILPTGVLVQGELSDDDAFVVIPGPDTGHLSLGLELEGGAAWFTAMWRGGEALPPMLVDGQVTKTIGVLAGEPMTVLLRPVFGAPRYRFAVEESPGAFVVEPNDEPERAAIVERGIRYRGTLQGGVDHVRLPELAPGPHRVVIERHPDARGRLEVEVRQAEQPSVVRRGRRAVVAVTGPGPVLIAVRSRAKPPPSYTLQIDPSR